MLSRKIKRKTRYLVQDFILSFAPSLTILHKCHMKPDPENQSFLGVANPTLDLRWAEEEVRKIASVFPGSTQLFMGFEARFEDFVTAALNSGYIHLAGHARFDLNDPYHSGFYLSDSGKSDDESTQMQARLEDQDEHKITAEPQGLSISFSSRFITLLDVFRILKLPHARLAVLSACESGMIQMNTQADEFIGLPAGFLYAGARAVLSSLWTVDDESTSLLMQRFYENMLHHNLIPAEALQKAQLWLRSIPEYHNPYYWAGFQVSGK